MKKALMIIDFINSIANQGGSCAEYLSIHPEVIDNANQLIKHFRILKAPIFHIRLAYDLDYKDLPKHAPLAEKIKTDRLFLKQTVATEFIASINIGPHDCIIDKTYGDIFNGNTLLEQLQEIGIEHIVLTGISTDNAIINSANIAMRNDFYVTVVRDACAAPTQRMHENALCMMENRTANAIITTDQALKSF